MGPLRHRSIAAWLGRHPWILSLLLVGAVAVPGLFRVESIARDARDAATAAQSALEGDCLTGNAGRVANQETWESLFDTLEELVGPEGQADLERLRAGVVLFEPTDCDGDGDVDIRDIGNPPTTSPSP